MLPLFLKPVSEHQQHYKGLTRGFFNSKHLSSHNSLEITEVKNLARGAGETATGKGLSGKVRRPESKPQNIHKRKQGMEAHECSPSTGDMEDLRWIPKAPWPASLP